MPDNPTPLVPSGKFPSATFLVFANRILAIAIAAVLCLYRHGTLQSGAPFWYFSPCSMSNVLSSYGQYAALKYVAFPLQVLFKSAKLIPVMMMGTFLSGTTYSTTEYLEALVIAFGVAVFSLSKSSKHAESAHSDADQMYGILLLAMYVTCDAFTNQWQSKIKKDYRGGVDSYQMMFAVNTFSILFTMSYLLTSGEWWVASDFMAHNPTGNDVKPVPRHHRHNCHRHRHQCRRQRQRQRQRRCHRRHHRCRRQRHSHRRCRRCHHRHRYNCHHRHRRPPTACSHILVNAVTSATGQLFIFYTVLKFGPVVLTIIMNTRQMMSMVRWGVLGAGWWGTDLASACVAHRPA